MKISFTLNQLEKYALSESRYWEIYGLVREYLGIPEGVAFTTGQLISSIFADRDITVYSKEGLSGNYISIRGTEFGSADVSAAIMVHVKMDALKASLSAIHLQEEDGFRSVRKARREFVSALDQVEW